MSDANVDVMGGETVTVNEVNKPTEATQEIANDSGQENNVPEAIPYERFSKVNNEKNELKQQLEEQRILNTQLSQNVNQYLESQQAQNVQEPKVPETVEDVMSFINQEIDNRVKPIEEQRKQETYANNVNNFFASDKDAGNIRSEIDQYYNSLPSYRQQGIVDSVSRGDMSVLNEIKNTVMLQHNNNLKTMASNAVASDASKTLSPSANKVTRDVQPGLGDLAAEGAKTGNFNDFFSSFVNSQGLA
jgi:hypothetical protein